MNDEDLGYIINTIKKTHRISAKNKRHCIAISVIIPVHNVERYLPKYMESVALQSFTDFNAIVMDDGSTYGL